MIVARETRRLAIGIVAMQALSIAMAIAAPYPAVRYVYPAALFSIPCIALGMEEIAKLAGTRARDFVAGAAALILAVFGGAALWAQAASAKASSVADWRMLQTMGRAFASGQDVVVIEDADFERSFWMRAELSGVDPRWPFLSYVARQYASGQPVSWPPSPPPPVRLTGWKISDRPGRFALVSKTSDLAKWSGDPIIVPANPFTEDLPAPQSLTIMGRFDERWSNRSAHVLEAFRRCGRLLNGRFRFTHDLGETAFPGHYWVFFKVRQP